MPNLQIELDPELGEVCTESESVIFFSALNRNGVFSKPYKPLWSSKNGVILYDSSFIYPLGEISLPSEMPDDFNGVLGRTANVKKVIKEGRWIVMNKTFAKLSLNKSYLFDENDLTGKDIEISLVKNETQLKDYCGLKCAFILEESQEKLDPREMASSLKKYYLSLRPALLFYKGQAVGMISSNFYSSKGAMINLLFIKKESRRRGLGRLLLKWYIRSLSEISSSIYLFYSCDNLSAEKLYAELGFKKIDNWIMALRKR